MNYSIPAQSCKRTNYHQLIQQYNIEMISLKAHFTVSQFEKFHHSLIKRNGYLKFLRKVAPVC
jgi:hypothetical protein